MAVLTDDKRFDTASVTALLEKLKGTYGSIQDIIDVINNTGFTTPEESNINTTHTIKFIDEDGLRTILQLIKDVKDNAGTVSQLNDLEATINAQLSALNDVVEVMNEDVNDLSETSEYHTTGLTGIINTANIASFNEPTETAVDTTHAIKFIGEGGLNAVLQLIKNLKETCESQFATIETQLNEITTWINEFNDKITE